MHVKQSPRKQSGVLSTIYVLFKHLHFDLVSCLFSYLCFVLGFLLFSEGEWRTVACLLIFYFFFKYCITCILVTLGMECF